VASTVRSDHAAVVAYCSADQCTVSKTRQQRTCRSITPNQHAQLLNHLTSINTDIATPQNEVQAESSHFYTLFNSILNNSHHALHHLLPHHHRRHNTTPCDPGDTICNFLLPLPHSLTENSYLVCFKRTHIKFINGHLTLPLIGQTLQQSYACSDRLSLLDVQTLFIASNVFEANHGFTLSAKRTAFTRSAITPPKVNRFYEIWNIVS